MEKKVLYGNIAGTSGFLLILTILIDIFRPIDHEVYNFAKALTWMIAALTVYLWINKRILFYGLIFYFIDFNIELLSYSILPINSPEIMTSDIKDIGIGFHIAGFICLIFGLWNKFDIKYLSDKIRIGEKLTLLTALVLLGFIQVIIHNNKIRNSAQQIRI